MDENIEKRGKEIFDEAQAKQVKLAKKLFLGIFGGLGFLFLVLAIVFIILGGIYSEIGIAYIIVGIILAALGVVLYFALPTKSNYEKYRVRVEKYGYLNIYEMTAKIAELEARIEELEKKINNH